MKPSPTAKHIHTFVKYKARPGYFRCIDPHCTAFYEREFLQGKAALCAICGSEFVLDREALRRARPRCFTCSNTKIAQQMRAAQSIVLDAFKDEVELP